MSRTITRYGAIDLHDERVEYHLLRIPRRRHVHLVFSDDGILQVRAPYRYSCAEAESAIQTHAAWVVRTLQRVREQCRSRPRLVSGVLLPLLDEKLQLEVLADPAPATTRRGGTLRVRVPAGNDGGVRDALEAWYRKQARVYLAGRVHIFAARMGVAPARIAIRGQKTRWGSCSARGTISLNWRLMLLPADLVDYVVVHELCHLRHMNHSARFWDAVSEFIPDLVQRRARLRSEAISRSF